MSVTHLFFGERFNQHLTYDCIPDNITEITFGQYFNFDTTIYDACFKNNNVKINIHYKNQHMPKNLIFNLYMDRDERVSECHLDYINQEKYMVDSIIVDLILDQPVQLIKITPKNMGCSQVKSARTNI